MENPADQPADEITNLVAFARMKALLEEKPLDPDFSLALAIAQVAQIVRSLDVSNAQKEELEEVIKKMLH